MWSMSVGNAYPFNADGDNRTTSIIMQFRLDYCQVGPMKLPRKIAGYILLIVGVLFPMFGILTTITCMMGDEECEDEAP